MDTIKTTKKRFYDWMVMRPKSPSPGTAEKYSGAIEGVLTKIANKNNIIVKNLLEVKNIREFVNSDRKESLLRMPDTSYFFLRKTFIRISNVTDS